MKTFNVVCRYGFKHHTLMENVSLREAMDFCDSHHWECNDQFGHIWDLEVEESDIEILVDEEDENEK